MRQRKLKQGGAGEEGGGGGVDIADFDFEGKKEEKEVKGEVCVEMNGWSLYSLAL